jgi:hypothetical protein
LALKDNIIAEKEDEVKVNKSLLGAKNEEIAQINK